MRFLIIALFLMLISCTLKKEERNINTGEVFHVYEVNWLTNEKHGESIHYEVV
ncbi:MAG: hypothetical protein RQ875_08575 [Vicingaceae bacterium]|nr:hypothetical protein [Vicingaceae bacterium]